MSRPCDRSAPVTDFDLYSVAPRLALARDQHNTEVRHRQMHELNRIIDRLELERLVAHRELQRAFHTRSRRYIAVRQHKLQQATAALARFDQAEDRRAA